VLETRLRSFFSIWLKGVVLTPRKRGLKPNGKKFKNSRIFYKSCKRDWYPQKGRSLFNRHFFK